MLTDKEKTVLNELRTNSRKSFSKIALKNKIPVTTIFDAHDRLVRKEVITKQTPIINFKKAGYPVRVLVETEGQQILELNHPQINNLHVTSNGAMTELLFKDMVEKQEFLEFLEAQKLLVTQVYDIIEPIKEEGLKV